MCGVYHGWMETCGIVSETFCFLLVHSSGHDHDHFAPVQPVVS
jgi:hypothetical protein